MLPFMINATCKCTRTMTESSFFPLKSFIFFNVNKKASYCLPPVLGYCTQDHLPNDQTKTHPNNNK